MFVDAVTAPDLTPMMRTTILCAALLLVWSLTGCFWRHNGTQPHFAPIAVSDSNTNTPDTNNVFTITPAQGANGRVASVNTGLNFVVLTFPIGQVPPIDAQLYVYRNGARAAEVKVTGPQKEDNTVADIVSGTVLAGDEVREK
jgi:hypothetical protein